MNSFFYYDGSNQFGPFSIDELKAKNISKETLVWYEGLSDWKKAGEIDLLEPIFKSSSPPPLKNEKKDVKKKNKKNELRRIILIVSTIIVIAILSFLIFSISNTSVSQFNNFEGTSDAVQQLVYSPDGKKIVAGSGDYTLMENEPPCVVNLWDVDKGVIVKRLNHDNSVKGMLHSLSFNKSGTKILISSGQCIRIESTNIGDLTSYIINAAEGDFFVDAVFSNKEDQVIYIPDFGNKVIFLDFKLGIKSDSLITNFAQIDKLKVSPDGSKLILLGFRRGDDNGYFITIFDLLRKIEISSLKIEPTGVMKFNNIGNKIALVKDNSNIEIRDVETFQVLKIILTGHFKVPNDVSFSYDDRYLASCSNDQMIKLYDIVSGQEVKSLINQHKGSVNSISFNPLSNTFATAGDDKTIKIWQIR